VHLIGIGGAGLSGIARVLAERGEDVSGSDQAPSSYSEALKQIGVRVAYGHRPNHVAGAGVVIASSAIPPDNVELVAARQAGIPVLRREAFLGELTEDFETIAIAGSHGKTTTSGLIAWVLHQAGLDPSYLVGGMLQDFATNAHAGGGRHFVVEADEYDRAFLGLRPRIAVVTSVDHDHPDCYPTPQDFAAAFEAFAQRVTELLLLCADDRGARQLRSPGVKRITYGLAGDADWRADQVRANSAGGSDFLVTGVGASVGLVRTRLPGLHNVANALAAIAVANDVGVAMSTIREALTEYHGAGRRFEILGQARGITVIDDYAHHPTEIMATLAAVRQRYPRGKVWAILQPHTYSRTRTLAEGFARAFSDADHVLVTEIFAAREQPDGQTTGSRLAERIEHPDVRFQPDFEESAVGLSQSVETGDVVITLSAGDANQIGRRLLELLRDASQGVQDER